MNVLPAAALLVVGLLSACGKPAAARPEFGVPWTVRVVLGPQDHLFTPQSVETFLSTDWKLSPISDRMGCRYIGPKLDFLPRPDYLIEQAGSDPSNIVDDGTPLGGIQVPSGLEPIVMGADVPSFGGYAKIATVISSDIGIVGQGKPGDVVRFRAVGVVEADSVLGGDRVQQGDVVIAMASSGVHSNGFSLVRHVLLEGAGMRLDAHVDELGTTLGEALLTPTKIYAKDCLAVIEETDVRAFSHVTGGGLVANLARVLPGHLTARLQRSWTPPAVFDLVQREGRVELAEMERTFNMGVGMVAIVPPADVDRTMALLTARHVDSWVLGEMVEGDGTAVLEGSYT